MEQGLLYTVRAKHIPQFKGETMKHLLILTLITTTLLVGCSDNSSDFRSSDHSSAYSEINLETLRVNIGNMDLMDLTPSEINGLLFMREEEKLARDVYLTFHEQYSTNVFTNIAGSEQVHTDAVLILLERYDITDPVGDNPIGVFVNEDLQTLYDELIASGTESEANALYVACAIEEIDILDLEEHMSHTAYKDIEMVYQHLLDGSGNHMRAFVPKWEQLTGEIYEPRFMSEEAFDEIMSASGPGNGGGGGGNGNGGGGNGGGGGGGRGGH